MENKKKKEIKGKIAVPLPQRTIEVPIAEGLISTKTWWDLAEMEEDWRFLSEEEKKEFGVQRVLESLNDKLNQISKTSGDIELVKLVAEMASAFEDTPFVATGLVEGSEKLFGRAVTRGIGSPLKRRCFKVVTSCVDSPFMRDRLREINAKSTTRARICAKCVVLRLSDFFSAAAIVSLVGCDVSAGEESREDIDNMLCMMEDAASDEELMKLVKIVEGSDAQ